MLRRIITIDRETCNGCGLCVSVCHEGAIGIIDGRAALLQEDYCGGLGDCLPVCPTGAITFDETETAPYYGSIVNSGGRGNYGGNGGGSGGAGGGSSGNGSHGSGGRGSAGGAGSGGNGGSHGSGSSGGSGALLNGYPETRSSVIYRETGVSPERTEPLVVSSQLSQWPVQIKLIPANAPYFDNANLLIAADCVAFAYADFHNRFMRNKITLIGCPKLDNINYSEKLSAIIKLNSIKSIAVVSMEAPCCSGIVEAVKNAIRTSGKMIPWQVAVISTDGALIE